MEQPPTVPPEYPGTRELLRIARGFSCLFWGLPLTLLLFYRALDVAAINRLHVPPHLFGVVLLYVGMGLLYFSGVPSPRWRRTARGGLFAAFLLLYFGPFVHWYATLPCAGFYFTANLFLFAGAVIWFLWAANRLGLLLGILAGNADFAADARICARSVLVLMLVPLLVALGLGAVLSIRYESTVLSEINGIRLVTPVWIQGFFLLPLSLTMLTLWKAKECSLHAVHFPRRSGARPGGRPDSRQIDGGRGGGWEGDNGRGD